MTAHINASANDFAKTVLMPGDPLRAKMIAEKFLDDAKLVTDVRNMFGYTGTYKGKRIKCSSIPAFKATSIKPIEALRDE